MAELQITIRQAEAADVAALSVLAAHTYALAFGHSMSAEDLATQIRETRSESYFRRAMRTDEILIAVTGGQIAGYVQLTGQTQTNDVELHAIYVAPDLQGQGIGTRLMDGALTHPRATAARDVSLDVWAENPRAIALYRRYGFTIVGKRDFRVGGRIVGSDLVMRRPLKRHV